MIPIELNPASEFDPVADEIFGANEKHCAGYDPVKKKRTIKQVAIDLLCYVDYYEDLHTRKEVNKDSPNSGSVGLPYSFILQEIQTEFPNCKTTINSLRWYAGMIRGGTYEGVLPRRRPRD